MANSLESQAEEDEKKKMEYSSSAPNKSRHVNSAFKQNHNTPWNSGFALSETKVFRGTQRRFRKISVRETIWDLEFSEHLL